MTLRGCDFPVCCAYDIYLHAWKRTWNGCNAPAWTHWNQYHNTFTVFGATCVPTSVATSATSRLLWAERERPVR